MNVLFVSSSNSVFGISPFIRAQGRAISGLGHNVDFFGLKGRGLRGYLSQIRPLRAAITAGRYDLVHAHYAFSGLLARMACPACIPVVLSYMGDDLCGTMDETGRQTLAGRFHLLHGRHVSRRMAGIIVKASFMLDYLPESSRKKAWVIPNGVDFSVFKPMDRIACRLELGLDAQKPYVLFLGDPSDPNKGFPFASEVYRRLADLSPRAGFLSPFPVPHERIPLYLNAADALLLCSQREGSPNVVKEAMACNVPVVATPVGDVQEVMEGVTACSIVGRDPGAFARAVAGILATGARSNGRERMARLESGVVASRIVTVYERILGFHA